MAEINIDKVEQKTRSPLPWLLAAVVLVVVLWFVFARNVNEGADDSTRRDSTYRDTSAAGTVAPPVDSAALGRDSMGPVPP